VINYLGNWSFHNGILILRFLSAVRTWYLNMSLNCILIVSPFSGAAENFFIELQISVLVNIRPV
jgi:hypothetical protein